MSTTATAEILNWANKSGEAFLVWILCCGAQRPPRGADADIRNARWAFTTAHSHISPNQRHVPGMYSKPYMLLAFTSVLCVGPFTTARSHCRPIRGNLSFTNCLQMDRALTVKPIPLLKIWADSQSNSDSIIILMVKKRISSCESKLYPLLPPMMRGYKTSNFSVSLSRATRRAASMLDSPSMHKRRGACCLVLRV
jgi:hypothetical protein